MENTSKVIVYGSLKRGFGNHPLMRVANAEFIDTATSSTNDYLMVGVGEAFPGLVKGTAYFKGEVYSISEEGLTQYLDVLESHPHFYKRQLIDVNLDSTNQKVKVWVYILSDEYIVQCGKRLKVDARLLHCENNTYEWRI